MSHTVIINSSHRDLTSNNRFIYKFPSSVKFERGDSVALQSISMYNSIFNVEASRSNNTVSIIWNADTSVQYNFTIPDGFYTVSQLNYFLQQQMILNNLYVTNASGNYIYFVELLVNSTAYSCQVNTFALPTSAQATTLGYVKPANATWNYPASATTPQLIVPTTAFGNLIGFASGTYPTTPQATDQQFLSSTTPQIAVVNSIIMTLNLTQSKYANPINLFYSIPLSVSFGSLINIVNTSPIFNAITESYYSNITIELLDQNFNRLNLHDFEIVVTLALNTGS